LSAVLTRALEFVEGQARGHGIILQRSLDPTLRAARCDPEQIYQVALNLIVNALQILPKGGVLTVRTVPGDNGRVGFEVSDNGPGIPPEARARIFTPFFTMRQGGTGLGLALVQRVVQAHQGTVSFKSVLGQGTTFRVELPTAEAKR
jgi:two-component system sensor histidine kinase HydH